jgi:hypothetical protein
MGDSFMRKTMIALATAAMALSGTALQAKESGEEKLAKILEGREAGEPVRCIDTRRANNLSIIDGTALVYRDGRKVYVNRTQHPENLDWNDVLVVNRMSGSRLCKLDNVTTMDRGGGFMTGVVFLTDFVPYEKVEDKAEG